MITCIILAGSFWISSTDAATRDFFTEVLKGIDFTIALYEEQSV